MRSVPCWSASSACLIRSASATSKPSASPSPASISGAIAGSTGSSGFSGHFAMPSGYSRLTRCERERRIASVDLEEVSMAWRLKGNYVETCSCELMCPCNLSFDHGATYDFCRVTLAFNIREGDIEGTDIGGLKVAVVADTPKVMTEGNWKLGVFVDEQATDEQVDKLVGVFSGQLGGPMAAMAPLMGEMLGVERAPIEVTDDGTRHTVRIGDAIDFEVED